MHWVEFEGRRLPKRIGGHPALDFCNTWAGWGEGEPVDPRQEWLRDYDTFAVWSDYAGLLAPAEVNRLVGLAARAPADARRVLTGARKLRTAVHDAALDPGDTRALAVVDGECQTACRTRRLVPGEDGHARWRFADTAGLRLPAMAVALAAAELLTSPEVGRVAACPGHECGWLFLNTTGRRRWCSMSACGNRAKVAAHAGRRKHPP